MRHAVLLASICAASACTEAPDGMTVYEADHAELGCGTIEPSQSGKMSVELATARAPHAKDANIVPGGVIDVYVHVIRAGLDDGDVPLETLHNQIRVLDAAYANVGYSFRIVDIDRTTNNAWFNLTAGSAAEKAAKGALHRGGPRDLNLYTASLAGIAGYATFPVDYTSAPWADGVVMTFDALPGGRADAYNLGDQTVHQVGHWLGLYHTYQPSCDDPNGDLVSDTPSTSMPAFGCPVGRDTCGGDSSEDPVRNYMDATDDACMNTFTPGQAARIEAQFTAFRRF